MPTLTLSPYALNRLVADTAEDKVLRAMDGIETSKMTVTYDQDEQGTIRATIYSVKWVGKKSPRCVDNYYAVQIHSNGFDCSCPAFTFDRDHTPCAHVFAALFAARI